MSPRACLCRSIVGGCRNSRHIRSQLASTHQRHVHHSFVSLSTVHSLLLALALLLCGTQAQLHASKSVRRARHSPKGGGGRSSSRGTKCTTECRCCSGSTERRCCRWLPENAASRRRLAECRRRCCQAPEDTSRPTCWRPEGRWGRCARAGRSEQARRRCSSAEWRWRRRRCSEGGRRRRCSWRAERGRRRIRWCTSCCPSPRHRQ